MEERREENQKEGSLVGEKRSFDWGGIEGKRRSGKENLSEGYPGPWGGKGNTKREWGLLLEK